MSIRLLICGSRNWDDGAFILSELEKRCVGGDRPDVVIHGNARGADILGALAATKLDIPIIAYPADWGKYGKAAGPIRNRQMLEVGQPTEVWAFHDDIASSKGTKDMIIQVANAGIPFRIYQHNHIEEEDNYGRCQCHC